MENKKINAWFEEFLGGIKAGEKSKETAGGESDTAVVVVSASERAKKLYNRFIKKEFGEKICEEIDGESIAAFESRLAESEITHGEAFDTVALLRTLFSFIKEHGEGAGDNLPDVVASKEVAVLGGLAESEAFYLSDAITSLSTREAAVFWIALHTGIPSKEIFALRGGDIKIENKKLVIKVSRHVKGGKIVDNTEKTIRSESFALEAEDLPWWRKILRRYCAKGNEEIVFASGSEEPGDRKKLQAELKAVAEKAGMQGVTLTKLEKTEWHNFADADADVEGKFEISSSEPDSELSGEAEEERDVNDRPEAVNLSRKSKLPTVSRRNLNATVESFPAPVVEHCRRSKYIAAFLIEHLSTEQFFIDLDVRGEYLASAAYYHDIGKKALLLDDYFLDGKYTSEQKQRYNEHTEKGVGILQEETPVILSEYPDNSSVGVLRDAITDHHEYVNGKGSPNGKRGGAISFAGRFVALVDELDHRLFMPKEPTEVPDTLEVLSEISAQAGKKYDEKLVGILTDSADAFVSFVEDMRANYNKKRKNDEYGMRYVFNRFVEFGAGTKKKDTAPEKIIYDAHLFLNDPFYGLVDSDIIIPALEDNPHFHTFESLALERLCRIVGEANEGNKYINSVILKLSVKEFEKPTFYTNLFRLFVNYGIRYKQLVFAVSEEEIIASGADMSHVSDNLDLIGASFAICEFGSEVSLLPSLPKLRPDVVIMKKKYAEFGDKSSENDMIRNLITSAARLGIDVYCPGVRGDDGKKIAEEFGFKAIAGNTEATGYPENESEKEFIK